MLIVFLHIVLCCTFNISGVSFEYMFISASHCSCCVFLVHSLIASHDPVIIVFSVQVSINMWRIIPLTYRRAPFAVCSLYVHSAEVVVHVSVTLCALFVCFFTILETQTGLNQ